MNMAWIIFIAVICVQALQLGSSARALQEFHDHRKTRNARSSRRELGMFSCGGNGNPIDDCWRCDPNWSENRQKYADCAMGFGKKAVGGKNGEIYVVTRTDDHPVNPRPGTLRHAVTRDEPLWIVFKKKYMSFSFKEELIVNSFKTIDGRGFQVELIGPACITVQAVSNVIISNLKIQNCRPTGNAMVRSNTTHYGYRTMADGDGISIFGSSHVWVDHCTLSSCTDGLIDAVARSTNITISNCYFSQHNEVMLLGHSDDYTLDKDMKVTVALNHFGEGLIQRMPRCRHGVFHVVNNDYTHWEMYAIGGSANPTILSQGNRFTANPDNSRTREVTKRLNCQSEEDSKNWNWISDNDIMVNGAYFTTSGSQSINNYGMAESLAIKLQGSDIDTLTADAGVLHCYEGTACS